MGVASNSMVKPRIQKLMELKFESRDELEIYSQVEATMIKTELLEQFVIKTEPIDNNQIVIDEEIVSDLEPKLIRVYFARQRKSLLSIDELDLNHFYDWTFTISYFIFFKFPFLLMRFHLILPICM